MKQIIKSLGMAVAIAFCSVNASAQFFGGEGAPFGGEGGPQRMSVEEMAKTQGTSIAKGLKLKKRKRKSLWLPTRNIKRNCNCCAATWNPKTARSAETAEEVTAAGTTVNSVRRAKWELRPTVCQHRPTRWPLVRLPLQTASMQEE